MQQPRSVWARIIEAIDKPLGFYVLALLIVEGFLVLVLTLSGFGPQAQERGMWAGIGLFVLVVVVVTICVWKKPTHLVFTEWGSLVEMGKASYGTEAGEVKEEHLPSGTPESKEKH